MSLGGELLSDVGEHEAVNRLLKLLNLHWSCESLPPGDDASCVEGLAARGVMVFKVDGADIASIKAPWMTYYDVGWLSVAAVASDLAAKAAKPLAFLISLGLPASEPYKALESIVKGAVDSSVAHGAWLGGGDTNSSTGTGWVDVAGVGAALRPIPLNRAKPGDELYVTTGRLGVAGAVLHSLVEGTWEKYFRRYPSLYSEFSRPRARLKFVELAERTGECITASTDVSDGLAFSLWRLARGSAVGIVVEDTPPLDKAVEEYAEDAGVPVEDLVFHGGQEYEVLFTVRSDCSRDVEVEAEALRLPIARIGRVVEGSLVLFAGKPLRERGWDNFKGFS